LLANVIVGQSTLEDASPRLLLIEQEPAFLRLEPRAPLLELNRRAGRARRPRFLLQEVRLGEDFKHAGRLAEFVAEES
jgi:hypothetical protein